MIVEALELQLAFMSFLEDTNKSKHINENVYLFIFIF
jgi:hypothetical protein